MGVPSRITISHGLSSVIENFLFGVIWFIFIHVVDAFFVYVFFHVDALLISK